MRRIKYNAALFLLLLFTVAFTPLDRAFLADQSSPMADTAGAGFPRPRADIFTTCAAQSQIPQVECEALVALYDSTNGAAWTYQTGWKQTDTPCFWHGVSCDGGHVSELELNGNNLNGTIPPELGSLTYIQELWFTLNQLSGSIPPELGSLTNLTSLQLSSNQLSGSIPPEIGSLTNLEALFLDNNQLSGPLPVSMTNLVNLEGFYYNDTKLCEPNDTAFQAWLAAIRDRKGTGRCLAEAKDLSASDGTSADMIILSWTAADGAVDYQVFRAETADGNKAHIKTLNNTLYNDRAVEAGKKYYYWVKSCSSSECTDFSNMDSGYRKLNPPWNLQASDGTSIVMVALTWETVSGGTSYKIYRSTTASGEKTLLATLTGTAYNDRTTKAGTRYFYWVTVCNKLVCSNFSRGDTGFRKLMPSPDLQASDGTYADYVHISWTAVAGATFYNVYRSTSSAGEKTLLRSPIGTLFYDRTAQPGIKYYYWVTACFKEGASYGCSDYSAANTGYR